MSGSHAHLDEESLVAHYRANGFISIEGFLDSGELSDLRKNVVRVIKHVVPSMPPENVYFEDPSDPSSLKQIQRLQDHDPALHDWLHSGPFAQLAALLLEDGAVPQNLQYFNKAPGQNRPTPPHQDGAYFPIEPMNAVTIWLALEDVTEEQGCVRYVAGSHLEGLRSFQKSNTLGFSRELAEYGADDAARERAFPCAAGHVIAHHAWTVHRAEANNSPIHHRTALGFIYYGESCTIDRNSADAYQAKLDEELHKSGRLAKRSTR